MMQKRFAIIENGVVVNLAVADSEWPFADQQAVLVQTGAAEIGWTYVDGAFVPPASPVPAAPNIVTRFQARAALHLAGLLQQVEALMSDPSTDMLARLAWQDAQEFRRTSPTVLSMAQALGLSEIQLDELFSTAAQIQA